MLYYKQVSKKKQTSLDDTMTGLVKQFSTERPAYGTRRLAAMVSRNLQMPVNRKQVQRICRKMGLIRPATTKKEATKRGSRKVKTSRPYEIWEVDITYITAGSSWAYCFTMLDVFTRQWVGYAEYQRYGNSSC